MWVVLFVGFQGIVIKDFFYVYAATRISVNIVHSNKPYLMYVDEKMARNDQ